MRLTQNRQPVCSVTTSAQGQYQFDNLACPAYAQTGLPSGSGFAIGFDKPGSNLTGMPQSDGTA
ncbi:hypothetical protein LP420_32690 [Massilia sp. B-10]|nr:hypothetical protein LP420_32690 [Massilia sp. B-10]